MFNQLTPADTVKAIGATTRRIARGGGATSEFDRDQLMSTYSATRHLAVELASYEPELRRFRQGLAAQIRQAHLEDPGGERDAIADRLEEASDAPAVGSAVCDLLDRLRADHSPQANALRTGIHASLRKLADTEVDLLADALG
jgi:hypothetical protein